MALRRDPSKALQLGFLVLLLISIAMVGYWMAEQVAYARSVERRLTALSSPDPIALAALAEERARRINRFLWEGAFFLAVLLGGLTVLTRTIRHDQELRRRQQNFLAAVSHEFKSPLASIRLAAETLVLRSTDPDSKRLGERILEDGERLLRMVDNLLETTRLEEGRHALKPAVVSVGRIAASVASEMGERARLSGVELTVEMASDLELTMDPNALETTLRNLVDNAIKACVAGSGRRVRVRARHTGTGGVELAVSDDGLGFSPDDAEMIFEKFHRLGDEERRTTPGTGLGLYIVKRLVELSGARIKAHSDGPGRGATVTIQWPKQAS